MSSDAGPIVRDGIARISRQTWGSGRGIWDTESEHRTLTVDTIAVAEEETGDHIRARMPRADDTELLAVDSGRAVEVNEMTLDAAAYVLRYEFDA